MENKQNQAPGVENGVAYKNNVCFECFVGKACPGFKAYKQRNDCLDE